MSLTAAEADALDVLLSQQSPRDRRPFMRSQQAVELIQVIGQHLGPDEEILDLHWSEVAAAHISITVTIATSQRVVIVYYDDGVAVSVTPIAYGTPVERHHRPTRPRLDNRADGPHVIAGLGHGDLISWLAARPPRAAWLPAPPAPGQWASGWYPDPGRRHDLRWWDGTQWWARVVDHGREQRKLVTE